MPDQHVGEGEAGERRQSRRSIAKGTRIARSTSQRTGRPSHIEIARKVSGGKPVTPTFITGQLRPHDEREQRQQDDLPAAPRELGGAYSAQVRPR